MKQHITIEQLNELSSDADFKLRGWMDSKGYGGYDYLPSIGKMIEFLGTSWMVNNRNSIGEWEVERRDGMESFENSELCDALWEAVKEVLEHE